MSGAPQEVDEVRGLARLAFEELRGAAGGLRDFHHAISTRAFAASGPGALPARAIHDAISSGVYSGLGGAARAVGAVADAQLTSRPADESRTLSTRSRGALVLGVLNGLVGDVLDEELRQPMGVRVDGQPVAPTPAALREAFPSATPRLAVFLQGLMETEFAWRIGGGEPYAARLRRDLHVTGVDVRYNTGLHISENGVLLADLLEELVRAWPVQVEEVALIGHSMGGLVARSGCHVGAERGDDWTRSVRHVVSLGSPHMGAPLAQGVHWASAMLHAVPETRPLARFLRRRSAGIRDLRQGSLVDEDWLDRDPDALAAVACKEVPLLDGATHCFVAATITRSESHPVARLIGDWLVLAPSASGRSRARRIPFDAEHGMHLGGTNHMALLNHPAVYGRLLGWLSEEHA
jgi:pimeloyl-ACP methyl ester carboxylesterase